MRKRSSLHARSRLLVAGAVLLTGCDGVVNPDGQAPGSAQPSGFAGSPMEAPGAAHAASGSGGGPVSPGVNAGRGGASTPLAPGSGGARPTETPSGAGGESQVPAALEPFTRLTRAEYIATVASALDLQADASLIPVDGRAGPFTSNTAVSPDPVHPYLILAEELAAQAVPAKLPSCAGAAAACVRDEYREPLERLYRRPLSDAEQASLAAVISELVSDGVPAEQATRAMLSAALISPDFLFRSAVFAEDTESRGRRLAERLSFTLWDAPPDAELSSAAAEAPPRELGARLLEQARRLVQDPRAVPVLSRFLSQWLHLDVDLKLEDAGFDASPRYRELLRFTAEALADNLAVTSIIAGNRGFVHRDNLEAYGLDELDDGGDEVVAVTWPEASPRRGLLGEELFADSTRHPDPSRRLIFRGRLVRSSLLCDQIPPPTPDLIAAAGEVADRTLDARCAGCHLLMDPIGNAFAALDPGEPPGPFTAQIIGHAELEGSYPDLPSLLAAVATSRAYAQCFAKNWLGFFLEVPLAETDPAWVQELADAVQAGAGLADVVGASVATLEAGSQSLEPVCQAR